MSFLPAQFNDFLSLKENRSDFIMKYLSDRGLKSSKIVIDGKSHVLVQYDSSFYNSSFRIKTVVAHHDRVENTPGANDNSAACWLLMNWACYLAKYPSFHNVRIFFTDGEELGSLDVRDEVLSMSACGRYLAVLYYGSLVVYNENLEVYASLKGTENARGALMRQDGSVLLLSSESAELFLP